MSDCCICKRSLDEEYLEKINDTYICKNCRDRLKENYIKKISDKMLSDNFAIALAKNIIVGSGIAIIIFTIFKII